MKNVSKKAAENENKMSLAARKAWETRRNKKNGNGNEKKEKKEKSGEVEKGKRFRRIDGQLKEIMDGGGGNVSVEQLRKGYRNGMLMNKPKRIRVHKSSVKLSGEGADSSFVGFLNGLTEEQVLVNKLCDLCWRRRWCMASRKGSVPREARLVEPMKVPRMLVNEN